MQLGQRVRFTHTAQRVTTFVFRGQAIPDPRPDINAIDIAYGTFKSEEEVEAAFRLWCAEEQAGIGHYMGYRDVRDGYCHGPNVRSLRVLLIVVNPRHKPMRVFECHAEAVYDEHI